MSHTADPVEFTYLVTYAWPTSRGEWHFANAVTDNPLSVITDYPEERHCIINVLQITTQQAKELEV